MVESPSPRVDPPTLTTTMSPWRGPRAFLVRRDPDTDVIVLIAATYTRLRGVGGVENDVLLSEITPPGLAKTLAYIQIDA
jgi:hypothetical protein